MRRGEKTKPQLLQEITELKRRVAELENAPCPREEEIPGTEPNLPDKAEIEPEIPKTDCDMLTGILGAMKDAIFLIDPSFHIDYINPFAEKEFGPVRGRKCYEYFHNRSDRCPWCMREKVARGRITRRIYKEPKDERVYDVYEAPITGPNGVVSKLAVLRDITLRAKAERALKLEEVGFGALVKLSRMSGESEADIAGFALEQALRLSRSKVGFMGFLDESESAFALCVISEKKSGRFSASVKTNMPVEEGSPWAKAIKRRRPVFFNDVLSSGQAATPLIPGHSRLSRLLCIPVQHEGRTVSVAAVGNKRVEYSNSDLRQFILLMDSMWKLIQRERDQQMLRQSADRMRSLAAKLLEFLEEERARVANEVHGNIGQMLAAMKFGAENALKAAHEGRMENMVPLLTSYAGMLQKAVGKARDIYMNLRPTVLDDFGVIAALFWLCARFQEEHPQLLVDKKLDIEEVKIPESLKLPIFRIVQEALNNSAAHSGAERITLSVRYDDDVLQVCLSDNGAGFDMHEILSNGYIKRGLGLATMKERTQISGGSFYIDSQKGKGTVLRAVWKLETETS